ncbi:magnesium transporter [Arthrobacter sp. MYb229]|uniref:magnesium transporter n=1 Tax=unclassified Arthrobacter TaxID=235627 RepID=UPI000CFC0CE7|nr:MULTISPECIES: magnesium transporter [unclassified Arthrobacter]PRA05850.1 magnesium transporter [Arthrobacter sp. MYb229]PRB52751.1 magnesium transporter [Arthrobacter sp. MYb216]
MTLHISKEVDFSTISTLIQEHLGSPDFNELAFLLRGLSLQQTLQQLHRLPAKDMAIVYRLLAKDQALGVFQRLDPAIQAELVGSLQQDAVSETFAGMATDDRVALLDELPAQLAAKLLRGLAPEQREAVNVLLGYRAGVVGHLMNPYFVTTRPELSVAESLQRVRGQLDSAESIYTLVVTDETRRLLGVVSLRALMAADEEQRVSELLTVGVGLRAEQPATEAARQVVLSKELLIPVVDSEQRVVGVFSSTDAISILAAADEERAARGSGAEPLRRPYLSTAVGSLVKSRIVWLLVLAVGASLTVQVLSSFEETLESMVVLSLFIPLIVGIGGNTGNQAATTVTRAIAMGDVRVGDLGRVMLRELCVGLILGLCLGTLGFALAGFIFGGSIALIIGITLVALCTIAAGVGGIMPIIGKWLKVDPAVFSNPFISTFVDAAGLIVYFSVAVAVLAN